MMTMQKLSIPLTYLFLGILFIPIVHIVFPGMDLIPNWAQWTGIPLIITGLLIIFQVFLLFRKYGTPHDHRRSTTVIGEGPFRYSRNPMYIGMTFGLSGVALCFGNILSFLAPFLFFLIMHTKFVPVEELKMTQELGVDYTNYQKRVRRWI